jgi:hypothetical protein
MFPALRKKAINFPVPLTSNVQSEPHLATYSYLKIIKTPLLQDVIKQNSTQNAVQEQQIIFWN